MLETLQLLAALKKEELEIMLQKTTTNNLPAKIIALNKQMLEDFKPLTADSADSDLVNHNLLSALLKIKKQKPSLLTTDFLEKIDLLDKINNAAHDERNPAAASNEAGYYLNAIYVVVSNSDSLDLAKAEETLLKDKMDAILEIFKKSSDPKKPAPFSPAKAIQAFIELGQVVEQHLNGKISGLSKRCPEYTAPPLPPLQLYEAIRKALPLLTDRITTNDQAESDLFVTLTVGLEAFAELMEKARLDAALKGVPEKNIQLCVSVINDAIYEHRLSNLVRAAEEMQEGYQAMYRGAGDTPQLEKLMTDIRELKENNNDSVAFRYDQIILRLKKEFEELKAQHDRKKPGLFQKKIGFIDYLNADKDIYARMVGALLHDAIILRKTPAVAAAELKKMNLDALSIPNDGIYSPLRLTSQSPQSLVIGPS